MKWNTRSDSVDLNAIYNMYSHRTSIIEKNRTHLNVSVKEGSPSPAANERPLSPLARSFSPRAYEYEYFDTSPAPSPGLSAQQQQQQQQQQKLLAETQARRRRILLICAATAAGLVTLGLVLGLGLGITIGRQSKIIVKDAYIPRATVKHTTSENNLMAQMFEWNIPKNSSHWLTLTSELQNLKVLGVKDIWIPPAMKNSDRSRIGYDVYDLWDLGEFNAQGNVSTNMGSKKQLQQLSQKAKELGIGVIFDAVFNQRTGADGKIECTAHTVNETDRLQITSQPFQIEAWLKFDFPARKGKYSSKTWTCDDFTAIDIDVKTGKTGIYKIEGANNGFSTDVSSENGNYDYLLLADVAYQNPSVRQDVLNWVKWVHTELEISGFRLDAAKHLSESFVLDVLNTIKSTNNGQDKFFAAEYFTGDLKAMTDYFESLESRAMMFDTLLLTNFAQFSNEAQTDMRQMFNYTFIKEKPEKTVTFVTTHDTQPGQSLDILNVSGWFLPLAYALTLLRKDGLPCLFYGDIYGTYDQYSTIFTPNPYRQAIANMAIARKYWAYGDQKDFFDNSSTIGWTRAGVPGDRPDGVAVVMSNAASGSELKMNVGSAHSGEEWNDITQNIISKTVTIGSDGDAVFPVRGQSVSVWINKNAKEGRDSLGKFNGDIYGLAPFEIGHATSNYEAGGGIGSGKQIILGN